MACADAKPPLESDPDADPIASIYSASHSEDAAGVESQLAGLTVADELPKPSGWEDDGPVLGIPGGDEVTVDKVPVPVAATPTSPDSRPRFPRRPQEPDCTYYLKFGTCRFGMKCKFNHPVRKKKNRVGSLGFGASNKGVLVSVFAFLSRLFGRFLCGLSIWFS